MLVGHLMVSGTPTTCAIVVDVKKLSRKSAVRTSRQRRVAIGGFIAWTLSFGWFFWFSEQPGLPSADGHRPRGFNPEADATNPFCSCFQELLPGGRQTHTEFVNCRPITWPRFRTSPAFAGRLGCLHPLQKKPPPDYYKVGKILWDQPRERGCISRPAAKVRIWVSMVENVSTSHSPPRPVHTSLCQQKDRMRNILIRSCEEPVDFLSSIQAAFGRATVFDLRCRPLLRLLGIT